MRAARPGDATGVTIVAIVGGSLGVGLVALAALSGCSRESEQAPVGALVEAAARGDAAGVRDLLDQGADVNGKDETGRTAVTAAVYAGSRESCDCSWRPAPMSTSRTRHARMPFSRSVRRVTWACSTRCFRLGPT